MRHDPRAYVADVIAASEAVARFIAERDLDAYQSDEMLRSAVERQLEIVGEALSRLARADAEMAGRIHGIGTIIGFRNVLADGYDIVDDELVWKTITVDLPALNSEVSALLAELEK